MVGFPFNRGIYIYILPFLVALNIAFLAMKGELPLGDVLRGNLGSPVQPTDQFLADLKAEARRTARI